MYEYTIKITFSQLLTLDRALSRELCHLSDDMATYSAYPQIVDIARMEATIVNRLRDKLDEALVAE